MRGRILQSLRIPFICKTKNIIIQRHDIDNGPVIVPTAKRCLISLVMNKTLRLQDYFQFMIGKIRCDLYDTVDILCRTRLWSSRVISLEFGC